MSKDEVSVKYSSQIIIPHQYAAQGREAQSDGTPVFCRAARAETSRLYADP